MHGSFDLIFIVRDVRDETRDQKIAEHVIQVGGRVKPSLMRSRAGHIGVRTVGEPVAIALGTPHFGVAHRQRWWPHGSVRERPIRYWIYSRMYSMVRTLQPYADGCTARGSFRQLVRPVLEICVRCREFCCA